MPNNDNEKYNWWNAAHDYGHGWSHGFQSRGIAPSFLGSDSLPQGIADLHWALHGIQDNMDKLDGKMGTFNDNIAKIANDMKKDVIEHLEDKIMTRDKNGIAPITTDTCYISKVMTTRTRIFSDSFGPETAMPVSDRIRGLTKNYDWIQYTQKNPTCEGEYDKIIDFNFVADHQENDKVDSRHVSKGKIVLDKAGMVKRVFVTQKGANIVLWYIVSQSIPSEIGVGYTGSIKRAEYDKDANLVSDKWLPVNHTPLMLLGAFSGDSNNETEFSQYVSTDYKLYQHIDGVDKEIGHLPTELIMLIDPLNDVVSDSKQAYIMKYNDEGKLIMPMKAFTLIDMFSNGKLIDKFSMIEFDNQNKLFTSFVSISPRTETTLSRPFNKDSFVTIDGGYHVELYDNNTSYPNTPHSHIFLLSSTKEVRDFDMMAPNMMNYHSDAPSEFSMKRERDYTEFNQITFKSGLNKMFPEIASDFGIPNDIPFTLETDWNDQKERVTIWLKEPFILERDISNSEVNNRRGFTVVHNSDYVKDIADTDILSVYKQLDFTIKNPTARNYLTTLPKYDDTYQLPKYLRYRVVEHSDAERGEATTEVTYFDENSKVVATIDSPNKRIKGNIKYNENLTPLTNRSNKFSPSVKSNLLSDLIQSDVIYLEGKNNHADKPYGSGQYTLMNETTGSRITQRLYCSDNATSSSNTRTVSRTTLNKSTSTGTLEFSVADKVSSSTSTVHKPMDLIQIVDMSGSLSDPEFKQRNGASGARMQQINDMIYVISNTLTDEDHIMLAFYGTNSVDSYTVNGSAGGVATTLLTKSKALEILNALKTEPNVHSLGQSSIVIPNYIKPLLAGVTANVTSGTGFEDVYKAQPNKNSIVSVLQFTDEWTDSERIDTSFVQWAKENAKTFMTVIDGGDETSRSYVEMKQAGHPNIQYFRSLNAPGRQEAIANKFISTAIETKTTKTPTNVAITIEGLDGVTLDTVSVTGPSNVNANKSSNVYSGNLSEGTYNVTVSVSGKVESEKNVTIKATYDNTSKTKVVTLTPNRSTVNEVVNAGGYEGMPVEEVVFTRTITTSKVGEWFGHGYTSSLKYLNIPGTYNTNSEEDGSFFRSSNPGHRVFQNIVSREITVDGISKNNTHVIYRLTNDIGLSMEYHNVVIREEREDLIGYTSKPWRLMYETWIPGEYVGNDEFPLGPDNDSVTKYMLDKIKKLEDTVNSMDGALRSIVASLMKSGAWDPSATPDKNTSLNGGLKSGIDLAYGNINLFGGALDGNSFIRTNNGQTENDLAGILDA